MAFGSALAVIRGPWFHTGAFIRGRWVHSGAPWGVLGLSWVVGVTQVRSGYRCVHTGFSSLHADRWIHPRSLGSLRCTMVVVGFIRGRWVHSGAPWWSLGSSGVVGFTLVRSWVLWARASCLCVHSGWLGSLGCALDRCIHPGPLGSFVYSLGVVGFILGGTRERPVVRWVYPRSFGTLGCALRVVGLILCRWVQSGATWRSLGLLGCTLGVVGFIQGRWIYFGAP